MARLKVPPRHTGRTEYHPVTTRQRWMLDMHVNAACTDDLRQIWVLAQAVLVRPRIDTRRLHRAALALADRHDILRTRFDRNGGDWRAIIEPPRDLPLERIDLGEMDDETFHARVADHANAPMSPLTDRLAELIVLECGSRGDVMITRVHHTISDGFGMIILAEDLLKLLMAMPIMTRAVSFGEYLARHHYARPDVQGAHDRYWRELHRNFPKIPMIGRRAKGLEPQVRLFGTRRDDLFRVGFASRRIEAFADRLTGRNATVPTALYAAFCEAICRQYDQDRIMFTASTGRTDPALDTFAGDHTFSPIMPHHARGDGDPEALVESGRSQMMEAIAHLPSDLARRGSQHDEEIIAAGGYPRQFSCYMPRALAREGRSPFADSLTSAPGTTHRLGPFTTCALDVAGPKRSLDELQLKIDETGPIRGFTMRYDTEAYSRDEIASLAGLICELLDLAPETAGPA